MNDARPHHQLENLYPLTPGQEGMYFQALLDQGSQAYLNQLTLRVDGDLDTQRLREAWRGLVARHAALRTGFRWESLEQPLQIVVAAIDPEWVEHDLRGRSDHDVQAWLAADVEQPLDLKRPGLHRVAVLRTGEQTWRFVLTVHHMVVDGWSTGVLFRDLFALYASRAPLATPATQFEAYAAWVAQRSASESEEYWRSELAGIAGPTILPGDRTPPGKDWRTGFADGVLDLELPDGLGEQLDAWARTRRLTLGTVVTGCFALTLARYSGENDVVHGLTTSGRPAELSGVESIVGNLVNVLPLRVQVDDQSGVVDFFAGVQGSVARLTEHQHSSLAQVQRWSGVREDVPLFSSFVTIENYPFDRSLGTGLAGLRVSEPRTFDRTLYPLNLTFVPGERPRCRFAHDRERVGDRRVARIAEDFLALLRAVVGTHDLDATLGDVRRAAAAATAPSGEDGAVLAGGAPGSAPTFAERFARAVASDPERVAVRSGSSLLTYGELDTRSRRVAAGLAARGAGAGDVVALDLVHDIDMVVAAVAVLRSGRTLLPLDSSQPDDRTGRIVRASGAAVVVGSERFDAVSVSELAEAGRGGDTSLVDVSGPSDLAYVVYTSGSTGTPKGVEVSHDSLAVYLDWAVASYLRSERGGTALFTSAAVDLSMTALLAPLCAGRVLEVLPTGADMSALVRYLQQESEVDFLKMTPSHLRLLLAELAEGRKTLDVGVLVLGGEQLTAELVRAWQEVCPRGAVVNEYGPTETTVGCTVYEVAPGQDPGPDGSAVSIGRPIPGVDVEVVDSFGMRVPRGVPGELVVAGRTVAAGYREPHDPQARGFATRDGVRVYYTGDLVVSDDSGCLTYLGRRDEQVKVHGHRLELGEIEAAARRHLGVKDCVAALVGPAPDGRLVAYVVPQPDVPLDAESLLEGLRSALPRAMVPTQVVELESIPLNRTGKVDRRSLPQPSPAGGAAVETPPRSATEYGLALIWQRLLDVPAVDVRVPFFDLGGHSILAVRLMAQIKKTFDVVLPLSALMEAQTIEAMALLLDGESGRRWSHVVPVRVKGDTRPSFWIHAAGGNVLSYAVMARELAPDIDIYGIQAQGLDEGQEVLSDLREMAARYVEAVREVQPSGPYTLVGWSFGGMVAVEMAAQLRAGGDDVAELVLIDTGTRDAAPAHMDPTDPLFLAGLAQFLAQGAAHRLLPEVFASLPGEERVAHFVRTAVEAGALPPTFSEDELMRILRVYAGCNDAYRVYHPAPLPPRTTLVRAEQNTDPDPTLGWSPPDGGELRVIDAPGNHVTVMHEAHVRAYARTLSEVLLRASS